MAIRKGGRTEKRIKRLLAHFGTPAWADNFGIRLPLRHALVTPPIRHDIYYGDYERKEVEIIRARLGADDRVLEVGAGIGFLSAFCARIVGDDSVFSYEANPALLPVIAEVHRRNGVRPTVTNVLLGSGDGERDFFVEPDFWASSLVRRTAAAARVSIRQIDLTAELRRVRPSFMIVDIEGGELEFFGLSEFPGVRRLCVEVHPDVIGNEGVTAMLDRLFALGFVVDFGCMRKNVFFLYRP